MSTLGDLLMEAITKKRDQANQQAINTILQDVLKSDVSEINRPANPGEVNSWLTSESMTPTPLPDMPLQAPGMRSMQPSLSGMSANPDAPPAYTPTFQTQGEATGLTADQIDPAKLGAELGLTQEVNKYKSGLQMLQQMANHPLFNKLQPGQVQKLIETITGIQPQAQAQQDPYTLSPGQRRFDAQGNLISEVPAIANDATGITLSPGQTRFNAKGEPIASVPATEKFSTKEFDLGDRIKIITYDSQGSEVKITEEKKGITPSNPKFTTRVVDLGNSVETKLYNEKGEVVSREIEKKGLTPQKPATTSSGKPATTFASYKDAQDYILANNMTGYVPSQTASGKWITKLQAGKKAGGVDWNAPPVTTQPAGKYKAGETRVINGKTYTRQSNGQWL